MLPLSATNRTLYLANTSQNVIISDIYAPFSLTIDPKNIQFFEKIRAIEYIWDDGTNEIVKYQPSMGVNNILPFPYEVGTPLNYPKNKKFYSKDLNLSVYNVKVNFYCFSNIDPYIFNITLNLKNPDIDYTDNSFFSEVHLIKTKMYGPKDKILYTFQSQNDEYLLMSNIDWELKPVPPITIKGLSRPYRLLNPFETKYTSNTGIRVFPYITSLPINPDNGGTEIRNIPLTPTII